MKALGLVFAASLLLAQNPARDQAWNLTFADEFNTAELDLSKWSPHDPWGEARDRQLQAFSPEAAKVSGGQLHLIVERAGGRSIRYDGKERDYVSGIVTTFGSFAQTYGRFEIRFKAARGRGLRSALMLLPAPLAPLPAIDGFEASGENTATVFLGNEWGSEQTRRSFGDSLTGPDLSAGFHIVAIEWDRDAITWFLDGKEKFRSTDGVPHQPMFLLLELAAGGNFAGRPARAPDDSTRFPASFDIDYVRVYQRR